MTWVEHAKRELELCGQAIEDPAYAEAIIAAVEAFASYGHSGGSASVGIEQLYMLLQLRPLSPITSDPAEWEDHSDISGSPLWQNRRDSAAMSQDAGNTWYYVDDRADPRHPNKLTPPDVRPYWPTSQPGDRKVTVHRRNRQVWKQVGWHGQSGAFYALGEDPSRHEPGSFATLWVLAEDEPIVQSLSDELRGKTEAGLLETAWGIIANASGGRWDEESKAWRNAAMRWRDQYHEWLSGYVAVAIIGEIDTGGHEVRLSDTRPGDEL